MLPEIEPVAPSSPICNVPLAIVVPPVWSIEPVIVSLPENSLSSVPGPLVKPGNVVCDVGTGSGILAIAAAKLGARRVVAVDTLAETVPIATENGERNGVGQMMTVAEGSAAVASELLGDERADLIVVNILARVIRRLAPELHDLLRPGGTFIFSGIIEHAAEELTDHLQEHGLDVVEDRRQDEWSCLIGQRRA